MYIKLKNVNNTHYNENVKLLICLLMQKGRPIIFCISDVFIISFPWMPQNLDLFIFQFSAFTEVLVKNRWFSLFDHSELSPYPLVIELFHVFHALHFLYFTNEYLRFSDCWRYLTYIFTYLHWLLGIFANKSFTTTMEWSIQHIFRAHK